ncbi:MAG TPA: LysM peptidoglycan-binding domain-containing protein [Anaerolineales bacterium]|nr:LysM peptidoglycan-binding domain-containing protein [Anaerolineales bacterium]
MKKQFLLASLCAGLAGIALGLPVWAQTSTPTTEATTPASATVTHTPTLVPTLSVNTATPTLLATISATPIATATPTTAGTANSATSPTAVNTRASGTFVPSATYPPFTGDVYVVQRGDTLYIVARKTGVSARALMNANPALKKDPNLMYPGMVLVVPAGGSPAVASPTPASNGGTPQPTATPNASGDTYVVQSGDTLFIVARKTGVSARAIINANPALKKDPNLMYPGMVLVIPR